MKNYTIIGGVNGVGKSSFTGVLKERSTDLGVIVDVDKITAELGGNALAGGSIAVWTGTSQHIGGFHNGDRFARYPVCDFY